MTSYEILERALACLDDEFVAATDVIAWASPVLSFGNPRSSRVATLALNPSNLEFKYHDGSELDGNARRFETLSSLRLPTWAQAEPEHLERMLLSFQGYFERNPYDAWFKPLNGLLAGTGSSFYNSSTSACHLDLVPFATSSKWSKLDRDKRSRLLGAGSNLLGELIRESIIEIVVLNGTGVVNEFERLIDAPLTRSPVETWDVKWSNGNTIRGCSFRGRVERIGTVPLGRDVLILGYNHNLQSGRGVTREIRASITSWIAQRCSS